MPIVLDTEDEDDIPVEPDPVALKPDHDSIAVDTARHRINSLLVNIEGSSWTVRYYSQILSPDSQVQPLQLDLPPVYQQYTEVHDMELKVTSPLSQSSELPDNYSVVTGAASVYPYLIPNQGDMFIADVGDGRDGVFTVLTVEKKTILKETCHEITYQLVDFATQVYLDNLTAKTVRTVHFRRDYLANGQNPFLISSEANLVDAMKEHYKDLLSRYVVEFYNRTHRTLLVPDSNYTIYDHFVLKMFRSVFTTDEHTLIDDILAMNCDGDDNMFAYTFWDCLLEMDDTLLPLLTNNMKFIPTRHFCYHPVFRGISFSNIDQMVYPDTKHTQSNVPDELPETPPNIHPVHKDDYYVLSSAFYHNHDGKSLLEIEMTKSLRGDAISHANLDTLSQDALNWTPLERFYYVPILLILLKVSLRRL